MCISNLITFCTEIFLRESIRRIFWKRISSKFSFSNGSGSDEAKYYERSLVYFCNPSIFRKNAFSFCVFGVKFDIFFVSGRYPYWYLDCIGVYLACSSQRTIKRGYRISPQAIYLPNAMQLHKKMFLFDKSKFLEKNDKYKRFFKLKKRLYFKQLFKYNKKFLFKDSLKTKRFFKYIFIFCTPYFIIKSYCRIFHL